MRHLFTLGSIATFAVAGPYEARPANVDCPVGYTLVGKKCEQNTFQPAQVTCSLGQLQGNRCITTVPPIQTCPIGSTQEGNVCKIFQYDQPRPECPNGFHLEGASCVQKKQLPVTEVCDVGRPDGRGQCVNTEVVSQVIKKVCPSGFQDEGHGCVKTTTYDCSPDEVSIPKPVFVHPAPVTKETAVAQPLPLFTNYKKKGWKRMLGAKKSYAPINIAPVAPAPSKGAAPIVIKSQPMAPVPPSNVAVVKQLCQREDYAPYVIEHFCPQGYAPHGEGCAATATYPMSARCINGNSIEACFEPKIAPVSMHCNVGALVGDKCVVAETINLETVCPAGTERVGGACQQITTPNVACPPGTILEGNNNCVGKAYTEPIGTVTTTCTGKACWQH
ncbi:putative oocyst wall protein [Gregarina niphandrodes]|uniref:Oocyst wall protein n=1 Tax=Gregarina niphandrodes TaxID=110365 RepID=A0A023B040_GRENI|nr:putative oocyst wall protein [Gregarina niphandrodes]EZG43933.1 putative oocyst wall protein [Gregarina niphandrodes]|eukprot:XP_011132904.1 putative oocyst wall protein [Gregarina niphandrodes]